LEEILTRIPFCHKPSRHFVSARAFLAACFLICAAAMTVSAQSGSMSPYQGESDGIVAGGKWMEFQSTDKMTGAKKVRFELLSNNYFREDPDYKPRVELLCTNSKYEYADFNPGVRLAPPNRPGFWGQPQLEVMTRIDGSHGYHGWNWVRGRFLSMDKGTTRGMLGAQLFNVEVPTGSGRQIAEFSPGGLDLDKVKQACDLTPKKP
jgi:hypothetical protein